MRCVSEDCENLLAVQLVLGNQIFYRDPSSKLGENDRDVDAGSRDARLPEPDFGVH